MKQGGVKIHGETAPESNVVVRTCMERGKGEHRV